MEFFISEEIGPNRAMTPAGFLLCRNVPLARTGTMLYAPGETPVAPGMNGVVNIERNADEVFSPDSLASFMGAPFTLDHPLDDVIPTNWRDLAHGDVLNARRGDGDLGDCVVADILIKSPEAIDELNSGKREVSVGYSCDYDQIEPGRGRQRNIVVNHVALVRQGRCGPRCSIGDKANPEISMTVKTADKGIIKRSMDRLRAAISTKDEGAVEKELKGLETITDMALGDPAEGLAAPGAAAVHIHLGDKSRDEDKDDEKKDKKTDDEDKEDEEKKKTQDARDKAVDAKFAAMDEKIDKLCDTVENFVKGEGKEKAEDEKILGALQMEAPPGTNDAAIRAGVKDSAILSNAYQETVSLAEILAPGIQPPAFDVTKPAAKTFDSICGHRRRALSIARNTAAMTTFIDENMPKGKTFDSMTCDETRTLFKSAAAVARAINNGAGRTADVKINAGGNQQSPINSIADLNKYAKDHFKTAN